MGNWEIAYDEGITDAERKHLETFKDELIKAFDGLVQSLRWRVINDDHGRKLYRVTKYSDRSAGLAQFTWADLENNDPARLAYRIKGGEFRCPSEIDIEAERDAMLLEDADARETETTRKAEDEGWQWDASAELWLLPDGRQADRYGDII